MKSRAERVVVVLALVLLLGACGRNPLAAEESASGALTGPITISGTITDANGLPQSGVRVNLDGKSQAVQTTTASGTYSFAGLFAGSYSVRPTRTNCSFVPDVVNLNNLTASVVQNFGGSGSGCGGTPAVNTGATSGAFTISGRVRDASNRGIVGARIALNGSVQALRFTDVTGGYSFRVNRGNYSLTASGACTITPTNANFNNLASNQVQNFTATTGTCVTSTSTSLNPAGAVFTVAQGTALLGVTASALEPRPSNTDAIARLQEIGSEVTGTMRSLTIAGLPAIERQATIDRRPEHSVGAGPRIWLTTAIATGTTVVRFDSQLPPTATAAQINSFFTTARNFTPDAPPTLHGPPRPNIPAAPRVPPATPPALPTPLFATSVANTFGEIVVAASDSSNAVVYARNPGRAGNSRVTNSQDGGQTVANSTLTLNAASSGFSSIGDPGLTIAAPNGMGVQAFYYMELFQSGMMAMTGAPLMAITVFRSTDGGQTFNQTNATAIDCNATGTCTVPDQPMIVADKRTQSMQGDRLYVTWRHFGGANFAAGAACSSDGGNTWSAADLTTIPNGADFPRPGVGPDGSLYVTYGIGQGSGTFTLWVQKFSSCDNGFSRVSGFPKKIKDGIREIPEMPGLDRQANGGPYMVAADDSDTTGNRVFATWIEEVSLDSGMAVGNDDVRVAESINGGTSWTIHPFPVNTTSNGHRYLPWICSTNGIAYVTWYDRRSSSPTNADPTAYFRASFSDQGNTGTPLFGAEVNVSGGSTFDDPACTSGFYPDRNPMGAVRSSLAETLCTNLPALPALVGAGACTSCPANAGQQVCGSGAPCDFRNTMNPCATMGETCSAQNGWPKYGDYNGAGCAQGQLYMMWASSVAPQGINCAVAGAACTTTANCCRGSTCAGGSCSLTGFACTANGGNCANSGACCSLNCLGGTCQPGVSIFASSTAVTTNTTCTTAMPDASFNAPFEIDTGPPSTIGAGYGTPACPAQFLVDVDLTQTGFSGQNVFVSGRWSLTLPASPCDEVATMTVFVTSDGSNWQTRDIVQYAARQDGTICRSEAVSHTDPGSVDLDGTNIPSSAGFTRVRVAITASQAGMQIPVLVIGVTN